MAIFGSYIAKEHTLTGESIRICTLDTIVALLAGLIIFPACFAFQVNPGEGPGLVFVTLPNIFNQMAGGRIFGTLFFIFMSFAALSTIIAVFENILSFSIDLFGWTRKKLLRSTSLRSCCSPCLCFRLQYLERNCSAGRRLHDSGSGGFHRLQYLLPLGSLGYLLFCTSRYGWGWKSFIKEADSGKGVKFPQWSRIYVSFILPAIVLFIFIMGYVQKFVK